MNLKTFRAPSMAEALAQVKRELGSDAVILHTRTYKVGSMIGLGGRAVVEITASTQDELPHTPRRQRQPRAASVPANAPQAASKVAGLDEARSGTAATAVSDRPSVRPESNSARHAPRQTAVRTAPGAWTEPVAIDLSGAADGARARGAATDRNWETERARHTDNGPRSTPRDEFSPTGPGEITRRSAERSAVPTPAARVTPTGSQHIEKLSTRVGLDPQTDSAKDSLEQEIAAIKRMVGQVLQCSRHAAISTARSAGEGGAGGDGAGAVGPLAFGGMPDTLFQEYLQLLEQQVSAEIADEIAARVREELNTGELADPTIVRQTTLRRLAELIPVSSQVPRPGTAGDGRPMTIALVGPTGVGKTTTIAKLAASYKLRHHKKVGLITSDTYRIAAVEQLRTYANIIGLPLRVALTPEEMASACESLADCDVVLIDTAGRSQHDARRLDDLNGFLEAANPHQTHLVLSLASSEPVMLRAAERFAQLRPSNVIFTKLDEAVNFGVLLNVAKRIELSLSFVTTGQEVPDHIEPGHPDRLARLVLDGEFHPEVSS